MKTVFAVFVAACLSTVSLLSQWPPVRLEARERAYVGEFRAEQEWPLARTRHASLYLDASKGALTSAEVSDEAQVEYDALEGRAVFDHRFDVDTELTGYMKLRLWVSAEGADDMDLFVAVQKLDADGQIVPFPFFATFDDGNVAVGWLRVSRRELDPERSTPEQPRYLHRSDQPLTSGEVVPVDIEIWPSGTRFRGGETLRLVVRATMSTRTLRACSPKVTRSRSTGAAMCCTRVAATTAISSCRSFPDSATCTSRERRRRWHAGHIS